MNPKMQALAMAIQSAPRSAQAPGIGTAPGGEPQGQELCACPTCGYKGPQEAFMSEEMEYKPTPLPRAPAEANADDMNEVE